MNGKIKEFLNSDKGKDLFIILIVILVAFGSFGLGRLSKVEEGKEPIEIIYPEDQTAPSSLEASVFEATTASESSSTILATKSFVASKNGTKYHFSWCSGAKQIKEENKIWFNSREEAEKAGYTKAANCKGL